MALAKRMMENPTAADTMGGDHFDESPFNSTPMVHLQFKHGYPFSVHSTLVSRYPKLAFSVLQPFSLKRMSRSAGHVLVHYLYSDSYQTLNWTGPTTGRDETIAKLRTAFEVYAAARQFDLNRLEELARDQVTLLSKGLDAFTIVDAISEAYPTSTGNDTWFTSYLKTVVKTVFEGSKALSKCEASGNNRKDDIPTANILLRSAVEVYCEVVESLAVKDVPATLGKPVQVPEPSQPEDKKTSSFETTKDTQNGDHAVDVKPEPEPEPKPVSPVPKATAASEAELALRLNVLKLDPLTKKPSKEGNTTVSNNTSTSGHLGAASTTRTPFGATNNATAGNGLFGAASPTRTSFGTTGATPFGTTNNGAAINPPGTSFLLFTPRDEADNLNPQHTNRFQSIGCMDTYKGWSAEELRLADYGQGRKKASTGSGLGGFGSSSFGTTGFGSSGTSGSGSSGTSGFGSFGNTGFGTSGTTAFGSLRNTGSSSFGTSAFGASGTSGFGSSGTAGFGAFGNTGFGTSGMSGLGTSGTTGFGSSGTTAFGSSGTTGFGSFGTSGSLPPGGFV